MYNKDMRSDEKSLEESLLAIEAGEDELIPFELHVALLHGENPVKVWRKYRGISQTDLAKEIGVTLSHISQIEAGTRQASVPILSKIAKALRLDLDDFYNPGQAE